MLPMRRLRHWLKEMLSTISKVSFLTHLVKMSACLICWELGGMPLLEALEKVTGLDDGNSCQFD